MPAWHKTIRVNPNRKVEFSVMIGQAQIASSVLTLGDKELVLVKQDSFTQNLGAGVNGKKLTCSTSVLDIRPETNDTSVTYIIRHEGEEVCETLSEEATAHGGIVVYWARVRFLKRIEQ